MDMEAIDQVIKVKRKAAQMEKELAALQAELKDIPTWTRLSSTDPYLSQIKIEWDTEVQQRKDEEAEARRRRQPVVPETIDLRTPEVETRPDTPEEGETSRYKTKYKAFKQAYREHTTVIRDLHTRLEEAEAEKEAAKTAASATKKIYVEAATPTDVYDPKSWTRYVTDWFHTPRANILQWPDLHCIKPFFDGTFQEPLVWKTHASTDGFFNLNCSEILFHPSDINRGLVVLPVYWFHPKGVDRKERNYHWELDSTAPARGQVRDVFVRRDQVSWIYLGEYQCDFSNVTNLNHIPFVNHEHIVQNAIIQKNQASRVSEDMIKCMYAAGILKVQCFGLRCIGFNEELDRQLHNKGGESGSAAPQSSTKTAGRKRKSGAEHKDPKPKKKKVTQDAEK